jgi:hypothetical protein
MVERGDDPSVTSAAIEHALTSPLPLTRYLVANVQGVPAYVIDWVVWLLPDRALDLWSE